MVCMNIKLFYRYQTTLSHIFIPFILPLILFRFSFTVFAFFYSSSLYIFTSESLGINNKETDKQQFSINFNIANIVLRCGTLKKLPPTSMSTTGTTSFFFRIGIWTLPGTFLREC